MKLTDLNNTNTVKIDTEGFVFKQALDFFDKKDEVSDLIPIVGFIITPDSGYGKGVALATEDCFINIPNRYTEDFIEISKDKEEVGRICSGDYAVRFKYIEPKKRGYKGTISVEFEEV